METFTEVKSLGPCSEEAEAALTDAVMLSLWYGGLNRIYVQKFRGEGQWLLGMSPLIPGEYLRVWASDNPHLRAFAYYSKAVMGLWGTAVVMLLLVNIATAKISAYKNHGIPMVFFGLNFIYLMFYPLMLSFHSFTEWIRHYRILTTALKEGSDPDLSDRVRMGEMRRTILGWAWNNGYLGYDRNNGGWELHVGRGRAIG